MSNFFTSLLVTLLLGTLFCVECTISDDERAFMSVPSPQSSYDNLKYITSEEHVAGTEGDYKMADYVMTKMSEAGIPSVEMFELSVLLNFPSQTSPPTLSVTSSDNTTLLYTASLTEEILDSTSDTPLRNHTYFGYAPSGSIAASTVFANYGRPEDFDSLENAGIEVEGKIVIVRYGQCFRGLKVMNAESRGAVGVLIYSDPKDDGYEYGDVYPDGPWRSESSVQRGSVQYNSICAGDPMRADKRYEEMGMSLESLCGTSDYTSLIPSIPALPLSYGDAKPILSLLGGSEATSVFGVDFDGALDIIYTVGPSSALVHFSTNNDFATKPIPNVIGKIQGTMSDEEDMPVLIGNHRDAWVYGAADPNSGTTSLLEVANGLGQLVKNGWKPKRSIYLLSWSGEEFGLLGSTGWAELNYDKISRASAYINVDTVVSGDELTVSATPSLSTLWRAVMSDLESDEGFLGNFKNGPLGNVVDANVNSLMEEEKIGTLGSGSDYTVFLDHFGIASIDFEFSSPAGTYGVYHSIYDSFDWIDNFGGTVGEVGSSFELMAGAAQIWGLLTMRLADEDILPFDHVAQAGALQKYQKAIEAQGTTLDLSTLNAAIESYASAAAQIATEIENGAGGKDVNDRLAFTERSFLSEDGLPGRGWMKHVLQAPGLYLGYAAEALPGVQQALDDDDLEVAQEQAEVAAECIMNSAKYLGKVMA